MDMIHVDTPRTIPLRSIGTMVDISGLDKSFGKLRVLRGLDLRVERGKVTAIVGPNGSGKTTLIKIILGLARADRGRIVVDGREVTHDGLQRERIGYMPQAARFPENLTARHVLAMLQDLRGKTRDRDKELIDAFDLSREMDKPLRTLSGGNRQKVSAVIAFLFHPEIVILDEPTAGLDPVASSILKDKIRLEAARGTTFILTSHIMSEIEELASNLAFLLDGSIRFSGPIDELKHATGQTRLERAIAHLMTGKAA